MAYQPTYPSPYMEAIDVNQEGCNIFKCLINPKDTILDATLNIYSNTDGSLVKTVELDDSIFPFVGGLSDSSWLTCSVDGENLINKRDYKWAITLTFDELDYVASGSVSSAKHSSSSDTIYIPYNSSLYNQLKDGGVYYITIKSERVEIEGCGYTSESGIPTTIHMYTKEPFSATPSEGDIYDIDADHLILTSPEYYFKARTNPTVTFEVPETISNSTHIFEAIYSQEQKVGVAYFQYDLYSNASLIASSGKIFTQKISHTFENLVNGTDYWVKLSIVNDDGVEICEERTFSVDYPITTTAINPVISADNNKACIGVDFSNNASIPSTIIGADTVSYKVFGTPKHVVVASGNVISYSSPSIIIEPYDNIMIGMYININNETIKIVGFEQQQDGFLRVSLEKGFDETPRLDSYYEIYSYYNGIHLNDGESIFWNNISGKPLVIPDRSTQVIQWHGSQGFNGVILEKINSDFTLGSLVVEYDGEKFIYKMGTSDVVAYCPYKGTASAIGGKDEHSIVGYVQSYDVASTSITLTPSDVIKRGYVIQIENEYRTIVDISEASECTVVVLDRPFKTIPKAGDAYVVYDDNYLYTLTDNDDLSDTDILICNDLSYKYWWLIVVLPDSVRFIKTLPFVESEV